LTWSRFIARLSPQLTFGLNSTLAYASAGLLTAALHETGHGLAAQSLGFAPRIYAFYEDNPSGTTAQDLIILAAGPLTSLALGVLFLALFQRGQPRYTFGRLFLFWLGWLGVLEFVNYLVVTPWLSAGDTAQIANRLGWALWPRYLVAAAGIGIVVLLARPAAVTMLAVAPESIPIKSPADRRRFIFGGFYLPLFAGTLLSGLGGIGTLAVAVGYGLLAGLGNIDLIGTAMYSARGSLVVPERRNGAPLRIEPMAVVLFVLIVAAYIALLSHGLPV
jgi:hypothetical protein